MSIVFETKVLNLERRVSVLEVELSKLMAPKITKDNLDQKRPLEAVQKPKTWREKYR